MTELIARRPLAAHAAIAANGITLRERADLVVTRITANKPVVGECAIRLGPRDWLLFGEAPLKHIHGAIGLGRDATSGLVFIQVSGFGAADALGLSTLIRDGQGAFTTRLADLRVTVSFKTQPQDDLLLIAERSAADYLWQWLAARIAVTMPAP